MASRRSTVSDTELAVRIMRYSMGVDWFKKSDTYSIIKSTRRIANIMDRMTSMGFFETMQTTKGHIVICYRITDKGRLYYRMQCLMDGIIDGSVNLDDPDVACVIEEMTARICSDSNACGE